MQKRPKLRVSSAADGLSRPLTPNTVSLVGERLLKWAGAFLAMVGILSAIGGTWWYFQDEKLRNQRWFVDDERWNSQIIFDLGRLAEEQARQRIILEEINRLHSERFLQMESSFEELEEEHQAIVEAIYQGLLDINYRVGVHEGDHTQLQRAIDTILAR